MVLYSLQGWVMDLRCNWQSGTPWGARSSTDQVAILGRAMLVGWVCPPGSLIFFALSRGTLTRRLIHVGLGYYTWCSKVATIHKYLKIEATFGGQRGS